MIGFAAVVCVVAAAVLLAVLSNRVSDRLRVPAPALFLIAAAVCATVFPALAVAADRGGRGDRHRRAGVHPVRRWHAHRLATVPGRGRRRGVARGRRDDVYRGGVAVAAHLLFGFDWPPALLIGTALSPTDPAVVFSVLGRREIAGRSAPSWRGNPGRTTRSASP